MAPFVYSANNMHKIAKSTWCLDSGASSHMSSNKNKFFDFKDMPATPITIADNSNVESMSSGTGKVKINLSVNHNMQTIVAQEVVYVLNLACNLLSVRILAKQGYKCVFKDNYCNIYDKRGALIAVAKDDDASNIYKLQCFIDKVFTSQAGPKNDLKKLDDGQLWHRRFGHLNRASMNLLKNGLVTGCDFNVWIIPANAV